VVAQAAAATTASIWNGLPNCRGEWGATSMLSKVGYIT